MQENYAGLLMVLLVVVMYVRIGMRKLRFADLVKF
jgi:hypothetical protein